MSEEIYPLSDHPNSNDANEYAPAQFMTSNDAVTWRLDAIFQALTQGGVGGFTPTDEQLIGINQAALAFASDDSSILLPQNQAIYSINNDESAVNILKYVDNEEEGEIAFGSNGIVTIFGGNLYYYMQDESLRFLYKNEIINLIESMVNINQDDIDYIHFMKNIYNGISLTDIHADAHINIIVPEEAAVFDIGIIGDLMWTIRILVMNKHDIYPVYVNIPNGLIDNIFWHTPDIQQGVEVGSVAVQPHTSLWFEITPFHQIYEGINVLTYALKWDDYKH
jgi:hypothetical protein